MRIRSWLLAAPLLLVVGLTLASGVGAGAATSTKVYVPVAASNTGLDSGSAAATPTTAGTTASPTAAATQTSTPVPTATTSSSASILTGWRFNTSATSVALRGVMTDVQTVQSATYQGTPEVKVSSNGIPSYSQTMTSSLRATLVARPNSSTDFRTGGAPSVAVGTPVAWGSDIGYSSRSCASPTPGAGYWPNGPSCPTSQGTRNIFFPTTPVVATSPTDVGGTVGYWVNGVGAYSWNDAQSYNNQGVWYRTAADWEKWDMDVDYGHAPGSGDYHHHFYSPSLAAQVGDAGTAHSPIYGWAADGYPIRGPWISNGVLAQSGWQTRDYSAGSPTGCGTANKRTCLMNDQANKNSGTKSASSAGPDVAVTVTGGSSVPVVAVSGVFAQDYYYDASPCTVAAACLDQYNGHDHDGLGYHYHMTITRDSNGAFTPRFPYIVGMKFRGVVPGNSFGKAQGSGALSAAMWSSAARVAAP
jgi:hypothetical protein